MNNRFKKIKKLIVASTDVMQIKTEDEVEDLKREANNFRCGVFLLNFE